MRNSERNSYLRTLELKKKEFYNEDCICHLNNCCESAINSHILQENGIISNISTNGRVYKYYYNLHKDEVAFKSCGKNDVLSFKAFCRNHDFWIFKKVEKNIEKLNFNEYEVCLLFSYRAILHEKYKKEKEIRFREYLMKTSKIYQKT